MTPLPAGRFPSFEEGRRSVHRDGHIEVAKAYYSVPPEYTGRQVWVRWDGHLVRIFNSKMESIAVHVQVEPGTFQTQEPAPACQEDLAGRARDGVAASKGDPAGPARRAMGPPDAPDAGHPGRAGAGGSAQPDAPAFARPDRAGLRHCPDAWSGSAQDDSSVAPARRPQQEQFEFLEEHPIIRPLSDYQAIVQASFGTGPVEESKALMKEKTS